MKKTTQILLYNLLVNIGLVALLFVVLIATHLFQPQPANALTKNNKTGAIIWSGDGLKLELQAQSLDVVRGFFIGREFSPENASFIAKTGCIFRSAMGNSGTSADDPAITVELAKWQITRQTQRPRSPRHAPRTRQDWAKVWSEKRVSDNAKTAFHWALYPTRQTYLPTDYNWGMISFALPPGARFDLTVFWQRGIVQKSTMFKGLECGK